MIDHCVAHVGPERLANLRVDANISYDRKTARARRDENQHRVPVLCLIHLEFEEAGSCGFERLRSIAIADPDANFAGCASLRLVNRLDDAWMVHLFEK